MESSSQLLRNGVILWLVVPRVALLLSLRAPTCRIYLTCLTYLTCLIYRTYLICLTCRTYLTYLTCRTYLTYLTYFNKAVPHRRVRRSIPLAVQPMAVPKAALRQLPSTS